MTQKMSLREIHKADTRQRLLDAASRVFDRDGYDAATVDQISSEAGASRPTFYSHFRDKEQVLEELMSEYILRAVPYMEKLPSVEPSIDDLRLWLYDVGKFLKKEKALFSLLNQVVGHRLPGSRDYGYEVCSAWVQGLAERSSSFAAAINPKVENLYARARAELLIVEIIWAGANYMTDSEDEFMNAKVDIVARSLHDFMTS